MTTENQDQNSKQAPVHKPKALSDIFYTGYSKIKYQPAINLTGYAEGKDKLFRLVQHHLCYMNLGFYEPWLYF